MEELCRSISSSFTEVYHTLSNSRPELLKKYSEISRLHKTFTDFISSDTFKSGNQISGLHVLKKLSEYSKILEDLSKTSCEPLSKTLKSDILITIRKLQYLMFWINPAFNLPSTDLSCLTEADPRKLSVNSITTTIPIEDPQLYLSQLQSQFKELDLKKALIYKIRQYKRSRARNLMTGWLLAYYSIFAKKKTSMLARLFDSLGDISGITDYWEFGETKLMKKKTAKGFPKIAHSGMIYVPRLATHVLDNTQELVVENTNEQSVPDECRYKLVPPDNNYVPIRMISDKTLPPNPSNISFPSNMGSKVYEKLIIHVHGGGYIAKNTYSYQSYTRKWASELDAPVFSIEYSLAPEHPFPRGIDDVWQAYTWLVNYSEKLLGVIPNKIVLVGDSAGGALITSLTIKAITSKFRVPDGLLLAYPYLNMDRNTFSPTFMVALEDHILPFSYLDAFVRAYLKNGHSADHPLVSPIFCGEEVLCKFPRTEIMVTESDPLSFDSYRFAEKLMKTGVNVHITRYLGIIHGALGKLVPMHERFCFDAMEFLKSLLNDSN